MERKLRIYLANEPGRRVKSVVQVRVTWNAHILRAGKT